MKKRTITIILIICLLLLCSCNAYDNTTDSLNSSASTVFNSAYVDFNVSSHQNSSTEPKYEVVQDSREFKEQMDYIIYYHTKKKSPKESISVSYSEKELLSFINPLSHDKITTLSQLNERYPLEFLINVNDGIFGFAYKLSEGGYLHGVAIQNRALFGDSTVVENIAITNESITVESFDSLILGKSTIKDVEAIDSSLARMNNITTAHLAVGNYYFDKEKLDKFHLPYTLHPTSNGMLCIIYERPDENGGQYIVKELRKLSTKKHNEFYWFPYSYGTYFGVDYEKLDCGQPMP